MSNLNHGGASQVPKMEIPPFPPLPYLQYPHPPYGWYPQLPMEVPKILATGQLPFVPTPPHTLMDSSKTPRSQNVALKKLPGVDWAIAKLDTGGEYYYNFETDVSTWNPPDDIRELVEQIAEQSEAERKLKSEACISNKQSLSAVDQLNASDDPSPGPGTQELDSTDQLNIPTDAAVDNDGIESQNQKTESKSSSEAAAEKFMNLLHEYDISPYSIWDIESMKIKCDSRFNAVQEKEARELFERYCRSRASELRKKGARDISKEIVDSFRTLLNTYVHSASVSFKLFVTKYRNHPRFVGLTNSERELLFKEHVAALKSKAPEKKSHSSAEMSKTSVERVKKEHKSIEDIKEDFFSLLDDSNVHPSSKWSEVQRVTENDKRYDAVGKHSLRRDWFEEYCRKYAKSQKTQVRYTRSQPQEGASKAYIDKVKTEREMRHKLVDLRRKEAKETLKIILSDLFRNQSKPIAIVKKTLSTHPSWSVCEILSTREINSTIDSHFESIKNKVLEEFNSIASSMVAIGTLWEDAESILLSNHRIKRLFLASSNDFEQSPISDSALINDIKAAYEKLRARRILETKKTLAQLLKDSSFVEFKVKNAIVEAYARAIEEKREPTIDDELALIKVNEIIDSFSETPQYKNLDFISDDRDQIIYDHIYSLMDMYRKQKCGTADRTIAEYSNNLNYPRFKFNNR